MDWQGTPIAGAAVGLATRDDVVTSQVLADPLARTDEQGRFRLDYPLPGEGATPSVHVAKAGRAAVLQDVSLRKEGEGYRAETDMGDILLAEGARLLGRVRDERGDPVPGARVTAVDALSSARGLEGMRNALCVAVADDSGIFSLPCALPQAARVQVSAEGYHHRVVSPVGRQTPLEVTLKPSGVVFGRVLDPRGSGVETTVRVQHERRLGCETVRTGPDGSFRFTLGQPGRYRLQAIAPRHSPWKTASSPLFDGPRKNIELVLEPRDEAELGRRLAVRCVDKETGQEVREFRAVSLWDEYANRNSNHRGSRLTYLLERSPVTAEGGVARVPGPAENQPALGCVRVIAAGRAPATVEEVEWKVPDGGAEEDLELTLELVPEAVVDGKVVDERTGAPIAGAKLWARVKPDPQLGLYSTGNRPPENAAVSGEDGAFRLGQLGEGSWEILVQHAERPGTPPVVVDLGQAEQRDLTIELPEGAVVQGRLVGAEIRMGSKVYLHPLPSFRGGYSTGSRIYLGPEQVPEGAVDVGEDGGFRFRGVELDSYMLMLLQPSPPRHGSPLRIEVEPFRVRRQGIDRRFDLSEDHPGVLRGRIELKGAEIPMEHLVVVARQQAENQNVVFSPFSIHYQGPRSFVRPSAEFAIQVTPGRYLLEVVDIATSLRLHATSEPIEVRAGRTEETTVPLELVQLTVKPTPPAGGAHVVVDRVEVRSSPAAIKNPNVAVLIGGNDHYDTGAGLTLEPDQEELRIVVPPGEVLLLARSNAAALQPDAAPRGNPAPLGRAEVTVEAGKPQTVELRVEPAPEPEGGGDADGVKVEKDG